MKIKVRGFYRGKPVACVVLDASDTPAEVEKALTDYLVIHAEGNTYPFRELLKKANLKWDPMYRAWTWMHGWQEWESYIRSKDPVGYGLYRIEQLVKDWFDTYDDPDKFWNFVRRVLADELTHDAIEKAIKEYQTTHA